MKPVVAALLAISLVACSGVTRNPVPEEDIMASAPYGIVPGEGPLLREWGDTLELLSDEAVFERAMARAKPRWEARAAAGEPLTQSVLALSGGGPDGAFSAGLVNGWSQAGNRPRFDVVTGISTGAIVALFAFLGPQHDSTLETIYTTYRTEQLIDREILAGILTGTALADISGYQGLIDRYIDGALVDALAAAHRQGRALLIGTSNLDASRPVVWNVAAIAATGHPDAETLIQDIIQASSAIPGVFPPVLIPVVGPDGRRYDEMHVDGGATQQVMFFSPQLSFKKIDDALGFKIDRSIYVVVNNALRKPYKPVKPGLLSVVGRSASSLISGSGTGDIYKIFAIANRDGLKFNMMSIPADFEVEAEEPFDPIYMRKVFDLGYSFGLAGDRWLPYPPDYTP